MKVIKEILLRKKVTNLGSVQLTIKMMLYPPTINIVIIRSSKNSNITKDDYII